MVWRDWQVRVMATNAINVQMTGGIPMGMADAVLCVRWATRERLRGPITGFRGAESALLPVVSRGVMPPR